MSLLSKLLHRSVWQYGTCHSDGHEPTLARRHRIDRNVQFILWPKGSKQGSYVYEDDFWATYSHAWWKNFRTESERQAEDRLVLLVSAEIKDVCGGDPLLSRLAARKVLERLRRSE